MVRSAPIEVIGKRWHVPNPLAGSPFRVRPFFHRNSGLKPGTSRAVRSTLPSARRPAGVAVAVGLFVAVVVATLDGDADADGDGVGVGAAVVGCMVGVLAGVVGDAGALDGVGVLASVAGLDAAVTEAEGEGSAESVDNRSAQPVAVNAASTLRPTANRRGEGIGAGPGRCRGRLGMRGSSLLRGMRDQRRVDGFPCWRHVVGVSRYGVQDTTFRQD